MGRGGTCSGGSHTDASQGLVSPVWAILHRFVGDTVLSGGCVIFNVEPMSGLNNAADDLFFGIPTNALKMMHRLQHEALGYLLPRLLFLPRLIQNEDYLWNTQVPLKTISYPVTTICESYFHFLCIWIPKWQYNCFLLQMGG
jgi:hypothetical protein